MENFRSMSCREGRMQMENYSYINNNIDNNDGDENYSGKNGKNGGGAPTSMQDLRSYSTSYASSYMQVHPQPSSTSKDHHHGNNGNSNSNGNTSSNYKKSRGRASSSSGKGWSFNDPEIQRKKRVASYKVYAVEGKMKGSFRKSFRWIKSTCSHVVHGLF